MTKIYSTFHRQINFTVIGVLHITSVKNTEMSMERWKDVKVTEKCLL